MYLKQKTTMESSFNVPSAAFVSHNGAAKALDKPMASEQSCQVPSPPAAQGSTMDYSDQTQPSPDMGSRWCPDEIEIFFECKSFFHGSNLNLNLGFQKYGEKWNIILNALHEESFSHRKLSHVISFYEQVRFYR